VAFSGKPIGSEEFLIQMVEALGIIIDGPPFYNLGQYQKRNMKIFQLALIQGKVIEGRPCKLS